MDFMKALNEALANLIEAEGNRAKSSATSRDPPKGFAKPFPGTKVGDLLYECSGGLADGLEVYVVVNMIGDYPVMVHCDRDYSAFAYIQTEWGNKLCFTTIAEAIRFGTKDDLRVGGRLVRHAQQAEADIAAGRDLSPYVEGYDIDDEDEEEAPADTPRP